MSFVEVFNDRISLLQSSLDEFDSKQSKREAAEKTDKSCNGAKLIQSRS